MLRLLLNVPKLTTNYDTVNNLVSTPYISKAVQTFPLRLASSVGTSMSTFEGNLILDVLNVTGYIFLE